MIIDLEKEAFAPEEAETKAGGVLGSRIEFNQYIIDIRWKDGIETSIHFPQAGFEVVDVRNGNKRLGFIEGEMALKILEEQAGNLTHDEYNREFSWTHYV